MDNNTRLERIRTLVSDISSCQQDALSHQENFKNASDSAYNALQDYLKSRNMKSTDELAKEVISGLSEKDQQEILKHLKELTPPVGAEYFLQPSELAKFLAIGFLASGVKTVTTPYYYRAKAFYISARSNALMAAARAGQGMHAAGVALPELNAVQRQVLLNGLRDEIAELEAGLEGMARMPVGGGIWARAEEMEKEIEEIEKAAAAVEKINQAETDALAAAGKITIWTKIFIAVNVVAIIGLVIYGQVKEHEVTEELHEMIAKMATARLYVRMSERMEATHTDQMSTINLLAQAFKDHNEEAKDFLQKDFGKTIDAALTGINEDNTYKILYDKDRENHANIQEDPSLEEMKKRRAADANKPLP